MLLLDKQMTDLRMCLILAATITICIFLRRKFVSAATEWKMDKNGITITWLKKIPFADYKDHSIEWSEIKKFRTSVNGIRHSFIIFLQNGHSIKFYHDDFVRKDDFQSFLNALDNYRH